MTLYNAWGGLNGIRNRQPAGQGLCNREGQDLNPALPSGQVYCSETPPALMHPCPSIQNNRCLFLVKHRCQGRVLLLFKWDSTWRDSNPCNCVAVGCWGIFSFWLWYFAETNAGLIGLNRKVTAVICWRRGHLPLDPLSKDCYNTL